MRGTAAGQDSRYQSSKGNRQERGRELSQASVPLFPYQDTQRVHKTSTPCETGLRGHILSEPGCRRPRPQSQLSYRCGR